MATHDGVFTATIASAVISLTTTNSAALPAGDTILVGVRASGTNGLSDTVNGAYTQVDYDGASLNHSSWIFQNSAGAASGAVTLTATGTSGTIRVAGDFFSGAQALVNHSMVGGSGIAAGLGTFTATAIAGDPGGDVVWAAAISATSSMTFTAGAANGVSETIGTQSGTANGTIGSEYALSTTAGSQASTMTSSGVSSNGDQIFQITLTLSASVLFSLRSFLPRAVGPRAVGPTFFSRRIPQLYPPQTSPLPVFLAPDPIIINQAPGRGAFY